MKNFIKMILPLAGILSLTTAFAQYNRHERNDRRSHDRYDNRYVYAPRPYYPAPFQTSLSIVAQLPFGAIAVSMGNRHYHYYDGLYYEPSSYGYNVVPAPVGIIVPQLPYGYTSVVVGGHPYYRYQNVFYMPLGSNGYEVVQEPAVEKTERNITAGAGTNVNSGYEKLQLEGKTYYKKGDKYYKARISDNGEIVYEEAGGFTP
jgi:hypothetical protein